MNHRDIAVLMDGIAPVLRGYVEKAIQPVVARMAAIEQRLNDIPTPKDPDPVVILRLVEEMAAKVPPVSAMEVDPAEVERVVSEKVATAVAALPPAQPGRDADPETISRMVQEEVAKNPAPAGRDGKDADPELVAELVNKAVAALESAKDGAPGPAGESVTVDQLAPLVIETVAKAVSDKLEEIADNLPAGKDGAPGEPGKGVTVEELAPVIEEMVAKRVSEIPPARDGVDGKEGTAGRDGRDGLPGVQGEKGIDGRHGADGKDGLGIDDFDVKSIEDGRALEFSLKREGAELIVKKVDLATVLDRGVWREQAYSKGDGVTWGGSFFIAQRQTLPNEKPGEVPDAFRLAVKRGRDGKEGKPGLQGEKGLRGEPGAPGRNYV